MEKILVIQQKMIGDVLASTLLCEHLKLHFPETEVHFLIHSNTLPVVEGNPFIDRILLFEPEHRKNKIAFFRFLQNVRKEKYSAVLDVYGKLETNLITLFSGASLRISYKKWYTKFIYTHLFQYSSNPETIVGWAIENRLLLLKPLIPKLEHPNLEPKIHLTKAEIQTAKDFLKSNEVDLNQPILMVGMLGSGPSKSYPLEYLATTLNTIAEQFKGTILLNYIPSQKNVVAQLLAKCSERAKVMIREDVFCVSLRSFISVLSLCSGYYGNEGGATNMSKALGLPNFSIFAPWISKKGWLTYNTNLKNQGVHLSDFDSLINDIPKKERKKNVQALYRQLEPELFKKPLIEFLQNHGFTNQ
ncbi:MAG: glycosyltransferase family 9 protein [Bacteroidota bacterium]